MANENTSAIISKVWGMCNPLRDDGVSHGDYLEQLTYLLFLKMADEYSRPPYNRDTGIPEGYKWKDLNTLKGAELEEQYKNTVPTRTVFAISSQHYAFVVNAFVALVKEYNQSEYEFSLREQRTYDIIEDVKNHRSQLGILYLSHFNREVIQSILKKEHLTFTKLFEAKPHVFVSKTNPLSNKKLVKMEDLENYPRLTYEQGINNSFYFSEELHSTQPSKKSIVVCDRATLFNLLIGLDGYTISSGILSTDLNGNNIVSIPLDSDEVMEIGYISDGVLSNMAKNYLNHLIQYIEQTK